MQSLSFLNTQLSTPAKELISPAPDSIQLEAILQTAMSVPDHAGLTPFRFLVVENEALQDLSRVFEKAANLRGLDADNVIKQKNKPLRSPMIIVVVACLQDNPSVPQVEQILCAGLAAQHIQLACKALGFGSIWLTGDNCYDLNVYEALGLDVNEKLVGFIYVGTSKSRQPSKNRKDARERTSYWHSSLQNDFAI